MPIEIVHLLFFYTRVSTLRLITYYFKKKKNFNRLYVKIFQLKLILMSTVYTDICSNSLFYIKRSKCLKQINKNTL